MEEKKIEKKEVNNVGNLISESNNSKNLSCNAPLDYYEVLGIIGQDKMSILENNSINAQVKLFHCPNKNCKRIFEVPSNNRNKNLMCSVCGKKSCRLCTKNPHKGKCKERITVF